jgi:FdrA protein
MSVEHVEARAAYADSVTLMQVTRRVGDVSGVEAAMVAMGTELNLDLVRGMSFSVPEQAGVNDLVVAIRAVDEAAIDAARAELETALAPAPRSSATTAEAPPRTTASALQRSPADLVLVSVPGQFAFAEATDALDAGSDVMVFSDNMPVEQEIALKRRAAEAGRLVMGPDCGTAVVGGAGFGFANVVDRGPVGIVAASGTGAQQLLCLLDAGGVGVSACLGVGGRDLSAAVGGLSTIAAMDVLDADQATELIVVVSKPPAANVAEAVRAHAATLATPVLFGLLGPDEPDLSELAETVLRAVGATAPEWPQWGAPPSARQGWLRGLYSGGTLCDEAMLIASSTLGAPVYSNIPLRPEWGSVRRDGPLMIDFGDDELTRGRAHPMIDPTLRLERLAAEAADPSTGVVLLDVVLGHGAHPDPATALVPAVETASSGGVQIVVAVIGSAGDPQGTVAQSERLASAGAAVYASNAAAARNAAGLVRR